MGSFCIQLKWRKGVCDVFVHLVSCESNLTSMYRFSVMYTDVCIVLVHVLSVSIKNMFLCSFKSLVVLFYIHMACITRF